MIEVDERDLKELLFRVRNMMEIYGEVCVTCEEPLRRFRHKENCVLKRLTESVRESRSKAMA